MATRTTARSGCRLFESAALNLRVGKDNISRGLEVLASIIARAEAQGAEVIVAQSQGRSQTQFLAFGQSVSFSVFETAHRRFPETPQVQNKGNYVPIPTFGDKPVEYVPAGKLTPEINSYGEGLRRTWKENKRTLGDFLPDIMATLFKFAILHRRAQLKRRAEAAAYERKANELRRLRHRVEVRKERRIRELEQSAENWTKAKKIREYILAVIDAKKQAGGELGPNTPTGIWAVWALQQADRLDPLVKSPPSILDLKKELGPEEKASFGSPCPPSYSRSRNNLNG